MPSSRSDPDAEGSVPGLREMRPEDLDDVLEIETVSFPTPWTRENFLYEIRTNPHSRNLVLSDRSGRILGYASVWIVGDGLQINNIAVAPARRGRGLGRVLVRAILALGRSSGCREATLEVRPSNRVARRLYRSHGFREVGRRRGYYADTGEDAILMNLDLD